MQFLSCKIIIILKVLTAQLRDLEEKGSLKPILDAMRAWGEGDKAKI